MLYSDGVVTEWDVVVLMVGYGDVLYSALTRIALCCFVLCCVVLLCIVLRCVALD